MQTYCAVTANKAYMGSFFACVNWANIQIQNGKAQIVKILRVRPNEKTSRIIFEVTKDGTFATNCGRIINTSFLKKALKDGKEKE